MHWKCFAGRRELVRNQQQLYASRGKFFFFEVFELRGRPTFELTTYPVTTVSLGKLGCLSSTGSKSELASTVGIGWSCLFLLPGGVEGTVPCWVLWCRCLWYHRCLWLVRSHVITMPMPRSAIGKAHIHGGGTHSAFYLSSYPSRTWSEILSENSSSLFRQWSRSASSVDEHLLFFAYIVWALPWTSNLTAGHPTAYSTFVVREVLTELVLSHHEAWSYSGTGLLPNWCQNSRRGFLQL